MLTEINTIRGKCLLIMFSRWFLVYINYILWLLHCVDLDDVADVRAAAYDSEKSATSPMSTRSNDPIESASSYLDEIFLMIFISKHWDRISHNHTFPNRKLSSLWYCRVNLKSVKHEIRGMHFSQLAGTYCSSWDSDHHHWPFYGLGLLCWNLQLIIGCFNWDHFLSSHTNTRIVATYVCI
jgi:hypothetical protein